MKHMDFTIDIMRDGDWATVRNIYLEGLATGNATFETQAPEWHDWDGDHLPSCRLVARAADRVVGWAALTGLLRSRRGKRLRRIRRPGIGCGQGLAARAGPPVGRIRSLDLASQHIPRERRSKVVGA